MCDIGNERNDPEMSMKFAYEHATNHQNYCSLWLPRVVMWDFFFFISRKKKIWNSKLYIFKFVSYTNLTLPTKSIDLIYHYIHLL